METTRGGDEYVASDTTAPSSPCHVPNPDVVSECGLSELPSSIHSDDETEHDTFYADMRGGSGERRVGYPTETLLSMRGEEPWDEELYP